MVFDKLRIWLASRSMHGSHVTRMAHKSAMSAKCIATLDLIFHYLSNGVATEVSCTPLDL